MQKINSATSLREAILQLEITHAEEGKILKEQFHLAFESIKPINLIKSTFKEAAESRGLKDNIVSGSIGLATGYLSKILFQVVTHSPIKRLLGTALMFGISKVVEKNPEVIKSVGKGIFKIFRSKPRTEANGTSRI